MSVGAVLTAGLGSFGSVNLLPTLGYLSSSVAPPPPPTPTPTPTPTPVAGSLQGQRDWPNFIADGDDNDYYVKRKKKREKELREVMAVVKAFLRTLH